MSRGAPPAVGRTLEAAFVDERTYDGAAFVEAVETELDTRLSPARLVQIAAGYERLAAELRTIASSRL